MSRASREVTFSDSILSPVSNSTVLLFSSKAKSADKDRQSGKEQKMTGFTLPLESDYLLKGPNSQCETTYGTFRLK